MAFSRPKRFARQLKSLCSNGDPARAKILLAVCLAGGIFPNAFAEVPNYLSRAWQAEDGLPENKVMAMVQTRDGYLWLGTYSGLARFDGVHFTVFDNNNTPEMRDSSVTSLFEADDGPLWIGHATGEITRCRNGKFQSVEIPAHRTGGKISGIATD